MKVGKIEIYTFGPIKKNCNLKKKEIVSQATNINNKRIKL